MDIRKIFFDHGLRTDYIPPSYGTTPETFPDKLADLENELGLTPPRVEDVKIEESGSIANEDAVIAGEPDHAD